MPVSVAIGIAGITEGVVVRVGLARVRRAWAVVRLVGHRIAVAVGVADVAKTVRVVIGLVRAVVVRAVVAPVRDAVAITIGVASIAVAICVGVGLVDVRLGGQIAVNNHFFGGYVRPFSPDGRYVVTGGGATGLFWHDNATGSRVPVGFFPDGTIPQAGGAVADYLQGYSPPLSTAVEYSIPFDWANAYTAAVPSGPITSRDRWEEPLRSKFPDRLYCGGGDFFSRTFARRSTPNGVIIYTECPFADDDSGTRYDSYIWDPHENELVLVSRALDGTHPASSFSVTADMSDDGRYVVYVNSEPVPGETYLRRSLFLWDRASDTRKRIWPTDGPLSPDGLSNNDVTISRDGSLVAVEVAPTATGGRLPGTMLYYTASDTYRFLPAPADVPTGATVSSKSPVVSPNGRYVLALATDSAAPCCLPKLSPFIYDSQTDTSREILVPHAEQHFSVGYYAAALLTDDLKVLLETTNRLLPDGACAKLTSFIQRAVAIPSPRSSWEARSRSRWP